MQLLAWGRRVEEIRGVGGCVCGGRKRGFRFSPPPTPFDATDFSPSTRHCFYVSVCLGANSPTLLQAEFRNSVEYRVSNQGQACTRQAPSPLNYFCVPEKKIVLFSSYPPPLFFFAFLAFLNHWGKQPLKINVNPISYFCQVTQNKKKKTG